MNSRAEILRVQHFYPWFSEMSVDIRHWQCWFEMMVAGALSLFHYGIAVVVGIVVAFVAEIVVAFVAEIVVALVAEIVVALVAEIVVAEIHILAELLEQAIGSICVHFRMANGAAVFLRPHVLLVAVAASSVLVRGVNL